MASIQSQTIQPDKRRSLASKYDQPYGHFLHCKVFIYKLYQPKIEPHRIKKQKERQPNNPDRTSSNMLRSFSR